MHRQRCHARNLLAGLFWGDNPEEQARKSLRTSLWRLRACLEDDAIPNGSYPAILIENGDVGFDTRSDYWLDVEEFESCFSRLRLLGGSDAGAGHADGETLALLTRAVDLHQGALLEGCYEDWCLYERERLQEMFLSALAGQMGYHHRHGAYDQAIRCGNRILSHDPLLEEAHRELMRLHCLAGNRGLALRQYRVCQAMLDRELGIEPMEETTALHRQICRHEEPTKQLQEAEAAAPPPYLALGGGRPTGLRQAQPLAARVADAIGELRLAQTGLQQMEPHFGRAIEALETISRELAQTEGGRRIIRPKNP